MADYIDREELLKEEQIFQQYNSAIKDDEYIRAVTVADIESQPSVDAVEVVKCKDCKHKVTSKYGSYCDKIFMANDDYKEELEYINIKDDDFCKWGDKNEIN